MRSLKSKISKVAAFRKTYLFLKAVLFDCKCVAVDLWNLPETYRRSRQACVKSSSVAFVCSLRFYREKKWQVVSQADLWHGFVEQNNALICGSFVSYWLFARRKSYVVGLEPRYNAPIIKFSKSHRKVFAFVSDSHSKEWLSSHIVKKRITDIITPYRKTLIYTGFHKPLNVRNVHSLAWCVADKLLDNVTFEQRDNKVLGFGNTGGEVYDLRAWSFETGVLASFNYAGSGNKRFSGNAYYQWLRNFDACVVAMSTRKLYNYTVAKYFEVASQGLLLFAFETDDFGEHGFIDGKNCIKVDKDNFYEAIVSFEKNPHEYVDIRINGYLLIKNNHTVSKRLEQLKAYIEG